MQIRGSKRDMTLTDEYLTRNEQLQSMISYNELTTFLAEDTFADLILRTSMDGKITKAHKIVLAARSRFFS